MIVASHAANDGVAGADTELPAVDGLDLDSAGDRVGAWGGDRRLYTRFLARALSASAGIEAGEARHLAVIAGWRAGVLGLREEALSSAVLARPAAAAAALGIAEQDLPAFLAAQALDRFSLPGHDGLVARVGGFRGFGGPWIAPPSSPRFVGDGRIEVDCGSELWSITADVFGARVEPVETASPAMERNGVSVEAHPDSYLVAISRQGPS